ncbi:MAG: hypothetical protein M1824_002384 [Vezdaea acicularis]|nr:MAG: hypothetical protein M1824_002384 [Vezdaea acicularis]
MTTTLLIGLRAVRSNPPLFRSFQSSPHQLDLLPFLAPKLFSTPLTRKYSGAFTRKYSTPSAVRIIHNTRVNAPASTLPAPLVVPDSDPSKNLLSNAFAKGKAYLAFYKTGLKNVWFNYRAAEGLPEEASALSRGEFQLKVRSRHDLFKLIPFGMILFVCGEFTPFVVVFVPNLVPWTCRIPRQVDGSRRAIEARRSVSFRNLTEELPREGVGLDELSRRQMLHISASLGLHGRLWPEEAGLPPDGLLWKRIGKRLQYLKVDDMLIQRDGGVEDMEMEEVKMALVERGVDVLGRPDTELRRLLESWLKFADEEGRVTLCLKRPNVWGKGAGV